MSPSRHLINSRIKNFIYKNSLKKEKIDHNFDLDDLVPNEEFNRSLMSKNGRIVAAESGKRTLMTNSEYGKTSKVSSEEEFSSFHYMDYKYIQQKPQCDIKLEKSDINRYKLQVIL